MIIIMDKNVFSGVGIGSGVTAIIQSSSASTGVVITMVGSGVLPLDLALFIILGANIGTCVTDFILRQFRDLSVSQTIL